MLNNAPNPDFLIHNLHKEVAAALDSQSRRVALYRQVIANALANAIKQELAIKVPRLRGLRRRDGPPFHATPELFFQQSGWTDFEVPEERFVVSTGEIGIMPRGMPHAETANGTPRRPFLTLITMFWPDGFSLHFGHATTSKRVYSDPHDRFLLPSQLLPQCLDEITVVLDASGGRVDTYVQGLMLTSISAIQRALEHPYAKTPASNHLVDRCQVLIEQHLRDGELSVKWLAEKLGCTPDHLSRAFQLRTGRTLIETINRARIEYAVHLMDHDGFNIGEIAWTSGYSTQSYFNRIFLRQMGMTPKQYRASIASARAKIRRAPIQPLA